MGKVCIIITASVVTGNMPNCLIAVGSFVKVRKYYDFSKDCGVKNK